MANLLLQLSDSNHNQWMSEALEFKKKKLGNTPELGTENNG
jgi:hypothetical protein